MKKMLIITGGQATGKTSFLYSLIDAFGEKSIIVSQSDLEAFSRSIIIHNHNMHPGTELVAIDGVSDRNVIDMISQIRPFGEKPLVVITTQLPASEFPESPFYRVHEMV